MKQTKKSREKISKKGKKNEEKESFQGFSVFHLSLFCRLSAFLGATFVGS